MKIETKFDIGQEVWFVINGIAKALPISAFQVRQIQSQKPTINYKLSKVLGFFNESELFPTRKEAERSMK